MTEQEVWLRAYCASLSTKTPQTPSDSHAYWADRCVKEYNDRFKGHGVPVTNGERG